MRVKKGELELSVSKVEGDRIKRFSSWLRKSIDKFGCVHPDTKEGKHCNSRKVPYLDWCEPCQLWGICENLEEIANNRGRK